MNIEGPLSHPNCTAYFRGHLVHWIQVLRPPFGPELEATVVAARDDGEIDITTDDGPVTLWHHDGPAVVAFLGPRTSVPARYFPKRGMLKFAGPVDDGHPTFTVLCVAGPSDERRDCLTREVL